MIKRRDSSRLSYIRYSPLGAIEPPKVARNSPDISPDILRAFGLGASLLFSACRDPQAPVEVEVWTCTNPSTGEVRTLPYHDLFTDVLPNGFACVHSTKGVNVS
jgi:hypothetical protein